VLREHTKKHPTEARWFYYLGDALHNLRRYEDAIEAYMACADLRGWSEESAWACYRAAECYTLLGRFDEAIEACGAGLVRHPGIAEIPRMAAYACYLARKMNHAVWWARLAVGMGLFEGDGASARRIGFRNLNALYEGPYDILRYALAALGDAAGAREANQKYHAAVAAREAASALAPATSSTPEPPAPSNPSLSRSEEHSTAS
jgi:tetratricopeptide (TPR) repeat protein